MKSPVYSKTLWVNGLAIAAVVLGSLTSQADLFSAETIKWLTVGLALVNFGLRFVTAEPLGTPETADASDDSTSESEDWNEQFEEWIKSDVIPF
jgi:hypothetical protein